MNFQEIFKQLMGIKTITVQKIIDNLENKPRRICFNSTHQTAICRVNIDGNEAVGAINLPFDDSIKGFIEKETKSSVRQKRNGKFWCPANSEEEYQELEKFVAKYKEIVFLRDTLENSIAISEHMLDDKQRTEVGNLEYEAKYNKCETSTFEISEIISTFINNSPIYADAELICAIPSSTKGELNLPQKIVQIVSEKIKKENISEYVEWKNDKPKVKELNVNEKLEALQKTDLNVNFGGIKNKNIILIDDLYQSGITMQYVGMKLKEMGANKIYGISIVKSRRDTDNND